MKKIVLMIGFALLIAAALNAPAVPGEESQAPDEGAALYNKKCAMCHGKDGVAKSMAEGSANLNDPEWQSATSVEEIVKVLSEGKGKMKGYKDKLSHEQIEVIATYAKQLK